MRQVIVLPSARADIRSTIEYIAADNPFAAERVEARIYEVIEKLGANPSGRIGRVGGSFEKLVKGSPYIIAYTLPDENTLHVLRVIHGARDWPEGDWPVD